MHYASVLFLLAAGCTSQSALIGEQDEPPDAVSTSAGGGSAASTEGAASTSGGAQNSTTGGAGAAAESSSDGTPPPPELGPCEDTTKIALSPEAVATRLAKLMFASKPSQALITAAQNGDLSTYGKVECQALEMIQQPEHEAGLLAFLDAWLEVSSWQHQPNPDLPDGVWPEMQSEATTFLESFVASGDTTLAHLLMEPETRVGAALAAHYGVEPIPEDTSEPVTVSGHRGLLSLGFLNASLGRIGQRGYFTTNKFMCITIALPANVSQEIPPIDGQSYRETYDTSVAAAPCMACHTLFDGPGHALESFDELGRIQETDAGEPIRTNGKLLTNYTGAASYDAFDDTSEFIERLSQNPIVASCLAKQAAGFTSGLAVESVDDELSERELQKVVERFEASDRDLSHLLVGLTQTDLFWQ